MKMSKFASCNTSYGLEIDSKGNCYAVGILSESEYSIPNRAYLLKYQDLTTSLNDSKIEQFIHKSKSVYWNSTH